MSRHVLFTAVKNEAPFLLEWIAYHKAIGFDTVIVFSNPSDDGTDELLAALAAAGEITHVPHVPPPGVSAQTNAARLANAQGLIHDGDWTIWLDADEFLNVHVGGGKVPDLLKQVGDSAGILIPWRIFGDSGHKRFPGRFISDDFVQAARRNFRGNREYKTLFRKTALVRGLGERGIHRPVLAADYDFGRYPFVTAHGNAVSTDYPVNQRWYRGEDFPRNNSSGPRDFSWNIAQINHYTVRTPEFFALKRARGRGWMSNQAGAANSRHTDDFYMEMNRNERQDRSILRHRDETDQELCRIHDLPGLAEAEELADTKTALALMRAACRRPFEPSVMPAAFELTLPTDEAVFLRETYGRAAMVLEYGSGGSTFVAAQGKCRVIAVENDPDWALRMTTALENGGLSGRARIHYADTGVVGEWGRPDGSDAFQQYPLYSAGVWEKPWFNHPDVVLIDGRFRTACFVNAVIRARQPMTILFDDYGDRPKYFWVERILKPRCVVGRMAVFDVVPGLRIPDDLWSRIFGSFTDVE